MNKHGHQVSLKEMLSHARESFELLGDVGREELGLARMMQPALAQGLEIVAEAPSRLTVATDQANQEIPCSQIIGMRSGSLALTLPSLRFTAGYGDRWLASTDRSAAKDRRGLVTDGPCEKKQHAMR